jgi:hypothetical protein
MTTVTNIKPTKPHCDSQMPYGYTFKAIDLYLITDEDYEEPYHTAIELHHELRDTHDASQFRIGKDHPNRDRIIWHVAAFIEGNLGVPYKAILVYSDGHYGDLTIYTPKKCRWWKSSNSDALGHLRSFLQGIRCTIDLTR